MTNANDQVTGHAIPGDASAGWHPEDIPELTKREYFAAMAMQGLLSNHKWGETIKPNDWDEFLYRVSSGSVDMADALISALNNQVSGNTKK